MILWNGLVRPTTSVIDDGKLETKIQSNPPLPMMDCKAFAVISFETTYATMAMADSQEEIQKRNDNE